MKNEIINTLLTNNNSFKLNNIEIINKKRTMNIINENNNNRRKTTNILRESENYKEIQNLTNRKEWINAVNEELSNMKNLNVFNTIKYITKNANAISSRWIFKYKRNANGWITKRKARIWNRLS